MKILFFLTLLIGLFSCHHDKMREVKIKTKKTEAKPRISFVDAFDLNYKISNLQNLKDSTRYFARIKVIETFGEVYVFELEELKEFEGVFLISKIPLVKSSLGDTIFGDRGLLFDQNCYWFERAEAKELKRTFRDYMTNTKTDTTCLHCLDISYMKVEQLDSGKYTAVVKYFSDLIPTDEKLIAKLRTNIRNYKERKHYFILPY